MPKTTFPESEFTKKCVLYYNHVESINWFLTDPLTPDEDGEKTKGTRSVPGHQRRKGPSDDSPINVLQSTAEYLKDPTLKSGNALPGRSVILKTDPALSDENETRRFTFSGRFMDLVAYLEPKIKYHTFIYDSAGGRHTLAPTVGEQQARR